MIKKLIVMSCCVFLGISFCGCALLVGGAVGGAGTAFWLSGKMTDEVSASYDKAIEAVRKAMDSLNIKLVKEAKSSEVAQIRGEYSDGRGVWIDIRPVGDKISKVEIRVGAKGDKDASTKILNKIKKYI